MPRGESRLLYVDHPRARGMALFREACSRDLEGNRWQVGPWPLRARRRSHVVGQDQEPRLLGGWSAGGSSPCSGPEEERRAIKRLLLE